MTEEKKPKCKATPQKRGRKPGCVVDVPRAARILAAANLVGIKRAAEQAGTTQVQIKTWQLAMRDKVELQEAFEAELRARSRAWRAELEEASVVGVRAMLYVVRNCQAYLEEVTIDSDFDRVVTVQEMLLRASDGLLEHTTVVSAYPTMEPKG